MSISINDQVVMTESLNRLRETWEETSDRLELLQTNKKNVEELIEYRSKALSVNYKADFAFGIPRHPSKEGELIG